MRNNNNAREHRVQQTADGIGRWPSQTDTFAGVSVRPGAPAVLSEGTAKTQEAVNALPAPSSTWDALDHPVTLRPDDAEETAILAMSDAELVEYLLSEQSQEIVRGILAREMVEIPIETLRLRTSALRIIEALRDYRESVATAEATEVAALKEARARFSRIARNIGADARIAEKKKHD